MMGSAVGDEVAEVTGEALPVGTPFAEGALGDAIVVLRHAWRFGPETGLAAFAEAVRRGDADAAVGVLRDGRDDVLWIEVDVADDAAAEALAPVRERLIEVGTRLREEAIAGRRDEAMEALGELRLLCGHRRGPYGAQRWQAQAQRWLGVSDATPATRWYPGRPLLVTANDYALQLFNGDTGVVVSAGDGRAAAVFERRGELVDVSPTLLSSVETVYAMTVHKAQGSQFASVALLLPDVTSRILTRELLYTGATRARSSLTLIGTEAAVRKAVTTRISRASGLRSALWGTAGGLRIHDFGGQGP
jgi:exodeoxyribonuclease V alpha subunit